MVVRGTWALAAQALPCARLSACSGPKAPLAPSPFSGFKSCAGPWNENSPSVGAVVCNGGQGGT